MFKLSHWIAIGSFAFIFWKRTYYTILMHMYAYAYGSSAKSNFIIDAQMKMDFDLSHGNKEEKAANKYAWLFKHVFIILWSFHLYIRYASIVRLVYIIANPTCGAVNMQLRHFYTEIATIFYAFTNIMNNKRHTVAKFAVCNNYHSRIRQCNRIFCLFIFMCVVAELRLCRIM